MLSATTHRKAEKVDDLHQKHEIKRLAAEAPGGFFLGADSGAKGDSEWHAAKVFFANTTGLIIVSLLLAVTVLPDTRGATYAADLLATLVAAGLDPQRLLGVASDTAASMTGVLHGAVEQLRQSSNNPLIVALHCWAHIIDLCVRAGVLSSTGKADRL